MPTSSPTASSPSRRSRPTSPARYEFGHGDVENGFKEADVIVERSFKTEATHQGYIEPHACLANVGPDGQGELWVCTQGHFMVRDTCARLLGMDVSKLRVTASEIGGGFGGKTTVFIEPVALALSRKANRPVKVVMSREEVFKATGPTVQHRDRRQDRRQEGRPHHRGRGRPCATRAAPSRARWSRWAP